MMIQLVEIAINRRTIVHRSMVILQLMVNMIKQAKAKEICHHSYVSWIKEQSSFALLRKELKIQGHIGEAHQRDKLTYVSLIHQINEAQEAGYDESEIVNSVIRAMSPSLTLRNVLETTSNLSLQRLLQFLESHFEETSATDLWGTLTSMIQLLEESEYSYVMKCIEIRQKVLLASSKSDIKYDKGLVMKLFYRILERVC